jgi:hypothetical protein
VTEEFVKANPTRAKEARKKGHLLISPQYFADCEAQGERLDPAPFLVAYAQTEVRVACRVVLRVLCCVLRAWACMLFWC